MSFDSYDTSKKNTYEYDNSKNIFGALMMQDTLRENSSTQALTNGIMLQQKKKYKEALAAFKQAAAFKPDSRDAYNGIATSYLMLGKKKEAIDAYKLSLKVDPNQEDVHIQIANLYIDLKKPVDAEKAFKGAISVNNTSVLAHYTLGHLYMQNNRLIEAEEKFRYVTRLVPKDGNAHYGLGMALNKMGQHDSAIKSLTTATKLKKDFVPALNELGLAYYEIGKIDKVQEQIDRLKKIDSSEAEDAVTFLTEKIKRPKITGYNQENSSLNLYLTAGSSLIMVDPDLVTPATSKSFSVRLTFDSDMDPASITNITNWNISKSRDYKGGFYDNGLYRSTDTPVSFLPTAVSYDPLKREAAVVFYIGQNASGDATIDLTRLTFQFKGKDANGKVMDPTADQFNGYKDVAY